jgi:hypothetical protein
LKDTVIETGGLKIIVKTGEEYNSFKTPTETN